jgi:hydrogenase maturation protease|tara:strand:+ start:5236 stop:5712 length:477 start_codon:yes stop_codon:yes gene_type:complete
VVKINVLGLGNVLHTDEGFGVEAVKRLEAATGFDETVEFIDGGTQGIYLLDFVTSPDRLLIFDAVIPKESEVKVYLYGGDELPAFVQQKMSAHQTGLSDLLSLAKLRGETPEEIVLIGIPPQDLNMHVGLSPEVEAMMPEAVAMGEEVIQKWLAEEKA